MADLRLREATPADRADLRRAVVALQEHERALHDSRLPGEEVADAYLAWLLGRVGEAGGWCLVAEVGGAFAGFVGGWVERDAGGLAETPDSRVVGYVSDLCVLPGHRGRGIAGALLEGIVQHFEREGVVGRVRVGTLAANAAALRAYAKAGFEPYEVVLERRVGR